MQRPVYQEGRILRTSDFVDEQAYHLAQHREHNRTSHVWGISSGLALVAIDGSFVVQTGHAVDGYGRDVVLDTVHTLNLSSFDLRGIESVDVWIGYDQKVTPGTGGRVDVLRDAALVETTDAEDVDPRRPPGVTDADIVAAGSRPPDDPARRWPVYLGRITRDLSPSGAAPVIDLDRRPYVGLTGATVETTAQEAWLTLTAGSQPEISVRMPGSDPAAPAPLAISAADGVLLNDRLGIDGELVIRGGALSILPVPPGAPAPAAGPPRPPTPEWSISHAEHGGAHELRVTMPQGGAVPNRLVVGAWRDGRFVPSLVIDDSGVVTITGNLVVGGRLQAASVQEAALSQAAQALVAGLQTVSPMPLFQLVSSIELS